MPLLIGRSRLRTLIRAAGLTQREFAHRLGVEESFISMIIKGERQFSYENAINAAEILSCHPKDLHEWIIVRNGSE